jgi:hypothetical protein
VIAAVEVVEAQRIARPRGPQPQRVDVRPRQPAIGVSNATALTLSAGSQR